MAWPAGPDLPVLYFNLYDALGRLTTSPETFLNRVNVDDSVRSFITQTEDPTTGLPSLFVHPCNTGNLLTAIRREHKDERDVLFMWLTSFAAALGVGVS